MKRYSRLLNTKRFGGVSIGTIGGVADCMAEWVVYFRFLAGRGN